MRLAERDFKAPTLLADEEILDILPVAEILDIRLNIHQLYLVGAGSGPKNWHSNLALKVNVEIPQDMV